MQSPKISSLMSRVPLTAHVPPQPSLSLLVPSGEDEEREDGEVEGKVTYIPRVSTGLSLQERAFFEDDRHTYIEEISELERTLANEQQRGARFKSSAASLLSTRWGWKAVEEWQLKSRMRTVSVALVLCLNIGVHPPDAVKPSPCARLEAWIDPMALPAQKALEAIGAGLQTLYERWQPRARYKQTLDPTVDDVKRLCIALRRVAKQERVLFHYNGHGVPRPTSNGEIWVFNRSYTQYIPLSVYDLQAWLGAPAICLFDCSNGGLVVDSFQRFLRRREVDYGRMLKVETPPPNANVDTGSNRDYILLAACQGHEQLPINPEFPADLFTACLLSPIKMALRWLKRRSMISCEAGSELIDQVPGAANNRKTPLGELNWIFTAVTDTIAWHVLPSRVFQKLFRQDLLVASLFRNFLLADRFMRSAGCTPVSVPRLPPTHNHAMWAAWDLAAENCVTQLQKLLRAREGGSSFVPTDLLSVHPMAMSSPVTPTTFLFSPLTSSRSLAGAHGHAPPPLRLQRSSFFSEQLTAFEVWLNFGERHTPPPMQLAIVLQVLLSQVHRRRALLLLAHFLDKGAWAVKLALSVGIFPYVLKLLQSPAPELRDVLVFIWTKVLSYDSSTQTDLVKENYQQYFVNHLASRTVLDNQRIMSAFVLSVICHHHLRGQDAVAKSGVWPVFVTCFGSDSALLRRWICLCAGVLWEGHEENKWSAIQNGLHDKIVLLLGDKVPEVRAAALFALGTLMGGCADRHSVELQLGVAMSALVFDGSPLVRRELVLALAELVFSQHAAFASLAHGPLEGARFALPAPRTAPEAPSPQARSLVHNPGAQTIGEAPVLLQATQVLDTPHVPNTPKKIPRAHFLYMVWRNVLSLTKDAFPAVATPARALRHYLMARPVPETAPEPTTVPAVVAPPRESPPPEIPLMTDFTPAPLGPAGGASKTVGLRRSVHFRGDALRALHGAKTAPAVPAPKPAVETDTRDKDPSWRVLGSTLFEMSAAHFAQPLMGAATNLDSLDVVLARHWRLKRDRRREALTKEKWEDVVRTAEQKKPPSPQSKEELRTQSLGLTSTPRYATKSARQSRFGFKQTDFDQVGVFHSGFQQVSTVLFHPSEPMLVAADNRDRIALWNYKQLEPLNRFSNANSRGVHINALEWINPFQVSLLLTACDNGVIRVWRTPHMSGKTEMVSSWVALRHLPKSRKKKVLSAMSASPALSPLVAPVGSPVNVEVEGAPGIVVNWQQNKGQLVCAGKSELLRVWDVEAAACTREIRVLHSLPSGSDPCTPHPSPASHLTPTAATPQLFSPVLSPGLHPRQSSLLGSPRLPPFRSVTSMCSTEDGNGVSVATSDGYLMSFDVRASTIVPTRTIRAHRSRVVSVALQRNIMISGAASGLVVVTEDRMNTLPLYVQAHDTSPLDAMAVHPCAPVFATGSRKQFVKVLDTDGVLLNEIKYHEGFLGQRIGPINSLAFHRSKLLLAAGAMDAFISVHSAAR